MKRFRSAAILVGVCLAWALAPSLAAAASDSRQDAELHFTEQRPGTSTGFTLSIDYVNPSDPEAKPSAVRRVVEELAQGALIDTSIPARCAASDVELMLLGANGCPAASRVGDGTITIDTGFPEPGRFIVADVVFLNNTDELIFLSTERDTGVRLVTRSTIEGRRIINTAPPLPGAPPDGGAIDVVQVKIDEISREVDGIRRGYVTTPGECPDSGFWANSISFTYADDVTQTMEAPSSCVSAQTTVADHVPVPGAAPAPGASPGRAVRKRTGCFQKAKARYRTARKRIARKHRGNARAKAKATKRAKRKRNRRVGRCKANRR
jgi:hypothetical protein